MSLLTTPEAVQPLLDQLVVDGVAATVAGAYRLTEAGSSRAAELAATDRDAWGVEPATAGPRTRSSSLDHRMKETVTAWQLKPGPDGSDPSPNDHADEAYDREVLDRLAAIHARRRSRGSPRSSRRRRGSAATGSGSPERSSGPGRRRRRVRRLPAGRQLPRRLVRAPRGPDRPRRPKPAKKRRPPAARNRGRLRGTVEPPE